MNVSQELKDELGGLRQYVGSQPVVPPLVHQETPLGELPPDVLESRYIIVIDDSDRIVGFVPSADIRQRLTSPNVAERERWSKMALSFLIAVTFPADADISVRSISTASQESSRTESNDLACIATRHDIFLSWQRLSAVLAGATSDPLTGLPNRMAFDRRLNEEWNRSERTGCSIGVILLDLDNFKATNDQHGHAVGDEVLRVVASRLEECLRSYDLVVRYGGDEFIALCLGCEPKEIEIPVRRLMYGLNTAAVQADDSQVPIRASIGAAVRHCDFRKYEPKDLVSEADRRLYQAKESRGTAVYVDISAIPSEGVLVTPDSQWSSPSLLTVSHGNVYGVSHAGDTP